MLPALVVAAAVVASTPHENINAQINGVCEEFGQPSAPNDRFEIDCLNFYHDLTGQSLQPHFPTDCSGVKSDVIKFSIENCDLQGVIPKWISEFANLEILQFHRTSLSSSIPIEIYSMTKLKELLLNNNRLTGTIPTEIGKLTALEKFNVGFNAFSGINPVPSTGLRGTIPKQIGNMRALKEFILLEQNGELTGSIPSEIGEMTALEILDVRGNFLSGSLPAQIGELSLSTCNVQNNCLVGSDVGICSPGAQRTDCPTAPPPSPPSPPRRPPSPSPSPSPPRPNRAPEIAGGVVGGGAALAVAVYIYYRCKRKRKRKLAAENSGQASDNSLMETMF